MKTLNILTFVAGIIFFMLIGFIIGFPPVLLISFLIGFLGFLILISLLSAKATWWLLSLKNKKARDSKKISPKWFKISLSMIIFGMILFSLSVLFGFALLVISPPPEDPFVSTKNLLVLTSRVKDVPGHNVTPDYTTILRYGTELHADSIARQSSINPGSIIFCVSALNESTADEKVWANNTIPENERNIACPPDYVLKRMPGQVFEGSNPERMKVNWDVQGRFRAYRAKKIDKILIFIGFKQS